jgi:hypothetical protein
MVNVLKLLTVNMLPLHYLLGKLLPYGRRALQRRKIFDWTYKLQIPREVSRESHMTM